MLHRAITQALLDALSDTPVVLLAGARQTGKSTLVQWLSAHRHAARYVTLDDAGMLSAARHDPAGFLEGFDGPLVLDEAQRAPELFLAIKASVDRDRQPGRFLLTGSANVLLLPRLAESLAGRMEILTLWPLSQGERLNVHEGFVDAVFRETLPPLSRDPAGRGDLLSRVLAGGYPEVLTRTAEARRHAWFGAYVTTIIQRDVRDLAHIEGLTALPRLLTLLAARAASLLNTSELSRGLAIPHSTLARYLALLETTFLVQRLLPWSGNLGRRVVKAPKILLADTGLLAHLAGLTKERLVQDPTLTGPLLENFVAMECRKQAAWSRTQPQLYHWRMRTGQEVDLVLENAAGRLIGLEVKAAATVRDGDFKNLRGLAEVAKARFHRGIVLYAGPEFVPFGPRWAAMPISALWRLGASARR